MADRFTRFLSAAVFLASVVVASVGEARAADALSHDVFFSLKDNSEAARGKLTAACQKYLSGHDGTVFFSVGYLSFSKDIDIEITEVLWFWLTTPF